MPKIKLHKTGEETEVSVVTAGHMVSGGYAEFVDPPARKIRTNPQVDEAEEEGYAVWTNAELADELGRRGLAVSGTKAELVQRLEENDTVQD